MLFLHRAKVKKLNLLYILLIQCSQAELLIKVSQIQASNLERQIVAQNFYENNNESYLCTI